MHCACVYIGFVGQRSKGVLCGKAGNIVSGLHRALNGGLRKVRRAGIAALVANVNSHSQRFVAVALYIFKLAHAYRYR